MATKTAPPPALGSLDEWRAENTKRHLRRFIAEAWPVVEQSGFRSNWHIDAICDHLEAVTNGEIRRLIINIPPRHMKSLAVSVFWPCWDWLQDPTRRFLYVSYAEKLSKRDSLKCRRLIESPGGRLEGGTLLERVGYSGLLELLEDPWSLTSDQNEKLRFENERLGYRLATSIGGVGTGEGGDTIVLDDPNRADQVESEVQRENVTDWIDGVLTTRFNDPKKGRLVVVQQRLHEADATGHLLERGGFEHLCLPAEYEPSHPFLWPEDPREETGELLWPNHFGEGELDELRKGMGSYRAAGQLQQLPAPAEGGIFQRAWWRRSGELPEFFHGRVHSWDMTFKDSEGTDFVCGGIWAIDVEARHLLAMIYARLDIVETLKAVKALRAFDEWPGHPEIAVEDKANGPAVMRLLRDEVPGLVAVEPQGGKEARAHGTAPLVEGGNVHLPPGPYIPAPPGYEEITVDAYIDQMAQFPNGLHDDMVDMTTQALLRLRRSASSTRMPRGAKKDDSRMRSER